MEMKIYHITIKQLQVENTMDEHRSLYIMSYRSKTWVPLICVARYNSYALVLITRQLGGMKYVPRTLGLKYFTGLFKHQSSLKEMNLLDKIRKDFYY
jgi:hypothetical protein